MLCVRNSGDTFLADYSASCGIDRGHAVAFRWPMSWSEGSRATSLACVAPWQGRWKLGLACPPELLCGDCPALRPPGSWTSYMKAPSSRRECSSNQDCVHALLWPNLRESYLPFLPFPICWSSQEAHPGSRGRGVKSASWWKSVKKFDTVFWNHHTYWIGMSCSISASSSIVTIYNPSSLFKTFCKF